MEDKFYKDAEYWFNLTDFSEFTKSIDGEKLKIYKKHKDSIITCRIEAFYEGYDAKKVFETIANY